MTAGVRRESVRTTGIDATVQVLNQIYPNRTRVVGPPGDQGSLAISTADCGTLGADRCRMRMRFDAMTDPWQDLTTIWLVDGRLRTGDRSGSHPLTAGDCFLYSISDAMQFNAQPLELVVIRISEADVSRAAMRNFGVVPRNLWANASLPVSQATNTHWRLLSGFVRQTLAAAPSTADNPLVARQLIEYVAASMLTVFPNATMQLSHTPSPGQVGPAALRRAVAFVDTNADQPITIEDIAAAAGTSARAVQYAFRRHLACSPRDYLRRVRLEGAHRALQVADPARGDTVASIALRWGFASTGWFTRHYRATYGRSPSTTLRENSS